MGVGESKLNLELMQVKNFEEIVAMVAAAAAKAQPGEWILGRGWHQEKWDHVPAGAVEGFPTHELLSKAAPNNPVFLTHASGHATIANMKAMDLAGITKKTPNPPGGEILKDKAGNPIGVFRERASGLVGRALREARDKRTPEQVEADAVREVEMADREYISKGVGIRARRGESASRPSTCYKKLADQGKLNVRLYVMLSEGAARLAESGAKYRMVGAGSGHLTVRTIKRLMDGALGSRGAWLLEPYADLPTSTGLNTVAPEEMKATVELAIDNGLQLETHAIGDRANRETLNVYEETFKAHPDAKDLRWRIDARAAHQRRRHPALRRARRHRHHAGDSLHVGRALRARAARRPARRGRRLRVAEADEDRRGDRQRHRRARSRPPTRCPATTRWSRAARRTARCSTATRR